MIDIIRKESLENLLSLKFVISFALFCTLIPLSFYVNTKWYRKQLADYSSSMSLNRVSIAAIDDLAQLASEGVAILRKPAELAILCNGLEKFARLSVQIKAKDVPYLEGSDYLSNALSAAFGEFDLVFLVQILGGLVGILFAYDAISGEKEQGTLKLILANQVPRYKVLVGKMISHYVTLLLALLPAIIIGLAVSVVYLDLQLEFWLRAATILVILIIYTFVFINLGFCVSSLTHRSNTSFLLGLSLWAVAVLIVPVLSSEIARWLIPVPSVTEMGIRKTRIFIDVAKLTDQKVAEIAGEAMRRTQGGEPSEVATQEAEKKLTELRITMNRERDEQIGKLMEDYMRRRVQQFRLALLLAKVSPASTMRSAVMELSQTGPSRMDAFISQAKVYRNAFNDYINKKSLESGPWRAFFTIEGKVVKPRIDLSDMPQFQEASSRFSNSLANALFDLLALILYNFALSGFTFFNFLHYDAR
jgi:ABC-type transport system involved in multi-copper enzyme maturation permease subunit